MEEHVLKLSKNLQKYGFKFYDWVDRTVTLTAPSNIVLSEPLINTLLNNWNSPFVEIDRTHIDSEVWLTFELIKDGE